MKRTRFIQRTVSTFLAAAMLATLASCNAKLPGSRNAGDAAVNQPKQIMNYYTAETVKMPEDFGYANNVFTSGENIYVYGSKSGNAGDLISGLYDFEKKEVTDLDLSVLNAATINYVDFADSNIVVSYMDNEEYMAHLAVVDPSSSEVKCSAEIKNNCYVTGMSRKSDSELAVVIQEYGPAGQKITLKTYNISDLSEKGSVDLSEVLSLDSDTYVGGCVFDNDGDLYTIAETSVKQDTMDGAASSVSRVVKCTAGGEKLYVTDEFTDMEYGAVLLKRANGNICVMSTTDDVMNGVEAHNFFMDELDNKTGEVLKRYNITTEGELSGICTEGGNGADFLYSNEKGIWKVNVENPKPEPLLMFGTDLPEKYKNIYRMTFAGDKLFCYGENFGDNQSLIYKLDKDGNIVSTVSLPQDDKNGYINSVQADADGKFTVISEHYEHGEDDMEKQICVISEAGEDGVLSNSVELKTETEGNYYMDSIVKTSSGDYAATVNINGPDGNSFIEIFDASGNHKAKIEEKDTAFGFYISAPGGDYVSVENKEGKTVFRKVDTSSYTVGEEIETDIPGDFRKIETDGNYDLCYQNTSGIYGYSFADKKITEIINWIDSDIIFQVWNAAFLGEDSIICQGYDYSTGEDQLFILKRADDETLKKIQNKKIMTIACVGLEYNNLFKEKVVDFNRNSDEFRVQVNDYCKFSKYEDDTYNSGAFQLNNDMASGNVPDILIGTDEVNMTSFAAKNILADLTTYFDNDADIKREDYFENLLDMCSYKGKLNQIFAGFSIKTIAGPASNLGKEHAFTYEQLASLKKNGRIFFKDTSRTELINYLIKDNLSEYVDFENKSCSFDKDGFAQIIDLIAEEGSTQNKDEPVDAFKPYKEDSDDLSYVSRYKDKMCQLELMDSYNFFNFLDLQQGALGEEAVFKGMPSDNGSGIIISPEMTFAICEKSKNKDAAWEFIKSFITKEYQDEMNKGYTNSFPIRKDSFDALLKKAKNPDEYCYYSVTKPDGTYAEMNPIDDSTSEKFRKAVESADRCVFSDERIETIIDEALDQVFNDQKSSQEAADEIQSKVSTYLNEIK
ncbi:extracellular solute-binding protein [Ruminococcus sp. HUN007]|uniref:extracellular solute-binding protein n=1 Tax=Ruminococcus sp. HUN007 TaxID=1514668 RepID=UPI0005D1CC3D|nr:extracellular solute-binding protein [Ruminococcus sp. HUN007]